MGTRNRRRQLPSLVRALLVLGVDERAHDGDERVAATISDKFGCCPINQKLMSMFHIHAPIVLTFR